MAGNRGINARQSGTRIIVKEILMDSTGAKVISGTTSVRCWELQTDGTYKAYDFNDNTFKTTALTTPSASATHRTVDNGTYNTGNWTYVFSTLTAFTIGEIYVVEFSNTGASPASIQRQFQYGGADGDLVIGTGADIGKVNAKVAAGDSTDCAATKAAFITVTGSVNDAAATTTSFITTLTGVADNFFKGQAIEFTSGTLATGGKQTGQILASNGTTGLITLQSALTSAPANGVTFNIIPTATSRKFADLLANAMGADSKVLLSTSAQSGVTIPTVTAITNDVGITQAGADKAWGTAARTLTAATNITSTGGTITVGTGGDAGKVTAKVAAADVSGNVSADLQTIKTYTVTAPSGGVAIESNLGTTQPVNFTGTAGSALVKTDMVDVAGSAVSATAAQIGVNLVNIAGSAVSTTTAQLGVNAVQVNAVSTANVTTINANQGTTQPVNFTGSAGSALAKVDMVDVAGAAVSTSTAQIGVNAVNIGGVVPGSATIGTVTDLTNAPTNGDLTGTMKTSVQTAAGAALTAYDTNGGVAKESSVLAIQNNTNFVCSLPDYMLIPAAGATAYKLTVNFYDDTGDMKDPDGNELAMYASLPDATNKTSLLYQDQTLTTPCITSLTFANYVKMVKFATGQYYAYIKIASTEGVAQFMYDFALKENTVTLRYGRTNITASSAPGTTTLADSSANKAIIAKALKDQDVSGTTAVSGSVYKDIDADVLTRSTFNATTTSVTVGTNSDKTGYSLSSSGLDSVLIDGKTLPVAVQIIASTTAGKVSGAGTGTEVFKGLDGSTTRTTASVDSSGNRTSIAYS